MSASVYYKNNLARFLALVGLTRVKGTSVIEKEMESVVSTNIFCRPRVVYIVAAPKNEILVSNMSASVYYKNNLARFLALVGITWVKGTSAIEKEMKSVVSTNIFWEPFWIYFYQKVYQQIDAKTDTEKT